MFLETYGNGQKHSVGIAETIWCDHDVAWFFGKRPVRVSADENCLKIIDKYGNVFFFKIHKKVLFEALD
jgi:hypothetical protein